MYSILDHVGNTPLIKLEQDKVSVNVFSKLEYFNPTGSVKDRAASYVIGKLLDIGEINQSTTIIESSSGNFGIALSTFCKHYGLPFYCVIDSNILPMNEMLIREFSTKVIKVTDPDPYGGYLVNRIKEVQRLITDLPNSYWINQYGSLQNAEAYESLAIELSEQIEKIDYVFMGVSSGGTITGVSKKMKELNPNVKIIAVDIVGSIIFGGKPQKRYIPGIGSSMVPNILKDAQIDEVVYVSEATTVKVCRQLLSEQSLFVGGSSGSVYAAIHSYFHERNYANQPNVVAIFPDRGDRYYDSIYNQSWCKEKMEMECGADVVLK